MQIGSSRSTALSSFGAGTGQIVGDNNIQNIKVLLGGREGLTHSVVHDLLALVYNGPLCAESELSLDTPVGMNEKLQFNNANKYMNVIRNHSGDYAMVRDAIREFPDSEKIIKKLGDLFYDVADYDEGGELVVGNGDAQLDAIKERLVDALVHDMDYDAHTHSTEDVESFCIALVACGVSRCIVLVKPELEEG